MKKTRYLKWLFLASLAGLAASCGTLSTDDALYAKRFHEADTANVVVRFYSWKAIHVVWPDIREDGFLPLLDRESVGGRLDRPDVGHELAVVVLGYMFTKAEEADVIRFWDDLMHGHGFRRVVLVRAGVKNQIDGLPIIHESAMNPIHEPSAKAAEPVAALATAVGADATNSPGGPVR